MLHRRWTRLTAIAFTCMAIACGKNNDTGGTGPVIPPPLGNFKIDYGDSILYLQNQSADVIVKPVQAATLAGEYSGFPEGIEIDSKTGAINVSKSEMGLRYKISFVPTGSKDTVSTIVLLSGINYLDGFYKLTTADSILRPTYNGSFNSVIPGINNGSVFDEGSGCNSAGCNVNIASGSINLAQTVRNAVFGTTPANNDRHEFQLNYRINDKSGKTLNTLKVKLYYFKTMNDVTQEAYDIIASRQGTILRAANFATASLRTLNANKAAKPRPPCIFIVAQ